jgi:FkbM family methyltransferase
MMIFSSLILYLKGETNLRFVFCLSLIKPLRFLNIRWLIVSYSTGLKYLVPLNQVCDWYHITTQLLKISEQFKPRSGWIVVDVGSNIGLWALWCAKKVSAKGIVVAIEPEPQNFAYLIYNKNLNKFSNVITLNLALADHVGKVRLYLATSTSHSIMERKDRTPPSTENFIEVSCKTLDEIISECGIQKVDLINLDVEGAALIVLKGGFNALKNKIIKRIIIEVEIESEAKMISEYLSNFSFKVFRSGSLLCAYIPRSSRL